ncbi:hypothetical protein VTK56DRAFT_6083 [Thermocarpiscus australiensis]
MSRQPSTAGYYLWEGGRQGVAAPPRFSPREPNACSFAAGNGPVGSSQQGRVYVPQSASRPCESPLRWNIRPRHSVGYPQAANKRGEAPALTARGFKRLNPITDFMKHWTSYAIRTALATHCSGPGDAGRRPPLRRGRVSDMSWPRDSHHELQGLAGEAATTQEGYFGPIYRIGLLHVSLMTGASMNFKAHGKRSSGNPNLQPAALNPIRRGSSQSRVWTWHMRRETIRYRPA